MIDIDTLARAYDPAAFEHHPIEERSHVAAIQWAARRKLATEAAERALPKIPAPGGALEALVAERDALRAQLDSMTPESRNVCVCQLEDGREIQFPHLRVEQRRLVGPWVEVTD